MFGSKTPNLRRYDGSVYRAIGVDVHHLSDVDFLSPSNSAKR